eukprot:bmy_14271T0
MSVGGAPYSKLLSKLVDSLVPSITNALVQGQQVTLGAFGHEEEVISNPLSPRVIKNIIYYKCNTHDEREAVIQQEPVSRSFLISDPWEQHADVIFDYWGDRAVLEEIFIFLWKGHSNTIGNHGNKRYSNKCILKTHVATVNTTVNYTRLPLITVQNGMTSSGYYKEQQNTMLVQLVKERRGRKKGREGAGGREGRTRDVERPELGREGGLRGSSVCFHLWELRSGSLSGAALTCLTQSLMERKEILKTNEQMDLVHGHLAEPVSEKNDMPSA